jgi:uncharacterized protein YoxC
MAEQVEVPIITAEAVTNLAELKKAITDAKKELEGMELGSEEYQKQLKELIEMQNLMRGAMNGTTASMDDLKSAADGTSKTYNGLVNQMASMKRELRNIDVSTEEGAKAFKDLAGQINAVNDELKEMDAMKGDFQRNVGNYAGALKSWAGGADALDKGLKAATGGVGGLKGGMEALAANPAMASIGLLVSVAMKLADSLKDNKTAMDGVQKAMNALKPVTDFFANLLETVAVWLGDILGKAANFLGSSGIIQKVIQGVVGVGNAIVQFVIAPFKAVIEAIKVFKEQGVKGLGDAAKAFGRELKSGVSFKSNYEAGQAVADSMLSGMASRKPKAKETGKEIGKEMAKGVAEGLAKELDGILDKINAAWDKKLQDRQKLHEQRQKEIADYNKQSMAAFLEEQEAEADEAAELWLESYHKQAEAAEESAQRRVAAMEAFATGTAELLGAIADAYESNGELTEKEEKRVKNLRIAAATINMLQGAVTAFATAQQLGPIAGPIVGAINAAAVIATGVANIAKIKSTNVSRDSAPTSSTPTVAEAQVSAPALANAVPTTTVVNGASTETALNNAARPQKVYVLQSDIEAAGDTNRVQVAESTF